MADDPAFTDLAVVPKGAKPVHPKPAPMPIYDFEHLGETLSDSLVQAAEDLSAEALQLADSARRLAADIRLQVAEQSKLLADINARLKASGEQLLEVHRKFNGGT